jgi:hypothetical protein
MPGQVDAGRGRAAANAALYARSSVSVARRPLRPTVRRHGTAGAPKFEFPNSNIVSRAKKGVAAARSRGLRAADPT